MKDGKSENDDGSEMSPEDREWFERYTKSYNTQGRAKLWNYFLDITKTERFKKKVKSLRERYKIPPDGFDLSRGQIYPPEQWAHRHTDIERNYRDEVHEMCKEYKLHFLYWSDCINSIVFYNELEQILGDGEYDICMFADLQNEHDEPFSKDIQDEDNALFPIAIRISPFASQRDIVDFVVKNSAKITHWQKMYIEKMKATKIGKVKKKKPLVQERNEFIYQNRHLPRAEIMSKTMEKFSESPDAGYIGKIISLEKKRRKEV